MSNSTQADSCGRIIYLCPATPKGSCQWEGNASDIFEHFQDSHKDLLMDSNTIKADVTQDSEQNRLMASEKGLFLAQTKVCAEEAKMWIRLRFLGSKEKISATRFSVEVICEDRFGFTNRNSGEDCNPVFNVENGVEIDVQTINVLSSRCVDDVLVIIHLNEDESEQTASKDVQNEVDYSHQTLILPKEPSPLDEIPDKDVECIKKDPLNKNDHDQEQHTKATLGEDLPNTNSHDKWELRDIEESCEENDGSSDSSEATIQCTNCHQNMIPPIFMCPDGHSVCYSCKNHLCFICEQIITDLRNIDLEEHTKTIDYPCRYEAQGCKTRCRYDQIKKHEIYCDFCIYKCELCVFEGRLWEIRSHFRIAHPSTKMYETMAGIQFPKGSNFVIINSNGVFYCTSWATETYVEWKVVFCGPKDRCFSCEVRIARKKQHYYPKLYFLKRQDNTFKWTVPFEELKSANVKEKNSVLFISSY